MMIATTNMKTNYAKTIRK